MSEDLESILVIPMLNARTLRQTSDLRILETHEAHYVNGEGSWVKVEKLQQKYMCMETGEESWKDVPRVLK